MLRRSPEQRTEQELRRQLQANVAAVGACYPSAEALREEAAEAERLAARDGVPSKTAAERCRARGARAGCCVKRFGLCPVNAYSNDAADLLNTVAATIMVAISVSARRRRASPVASR